MAGFAQDDQSASPGDSASEFEEGRADAEEDGLEGPGASPTEDGNGEEASSEGTEDSEEEVDRSLARPFPAGANVDQGALEAYREALKAYESEIKDYRSTVQEIAERTYLSRREEINEVYDEQIEELRKEERRERNEAIEEFETFLSRYPEHPEYTPDVLFRLAELYYEKTEDQYMMTDREYARLEREYDLGLLAELPPPPEKDFTETIELFERLIAEFPDYRDIDGAYYLLGISYLQMEESDEAVDNFHTLVQLYPNSEFAQETWLRIGEYYFDGAQFELARGAYRRAIEYGDSIWYDKTLFKLGWSNYLLQEFDQALTRFEELLDYYEEKGDRSEQAVREETLQYYAISLAEDDWNLDGLVDEDFILPRVENYLGEEKPYTKEILDRLAETLFDRGRYEPSIAVNEYVIGRYPLDPKNPRRHDQIITAYARLNNLDQALAEGRRFSDLYGQGSDWFYEQQRLGNLEEIAFAEEVARDMLVQTANRVYVAAEEKMREGSLAEDEAMMAEAREMYENAASIYREFLSAYPNDPQAYKVRMYLAQSLYYSQNYAEAGKQFSRVRDSQLSNEFAEIAGSFAIVSLERALREEIDAGRLEARAWPAYGTEGPAMPAIDEEGSDEERDDPAGDPIPELSQEWVNAIDGYVERDLNPEEDPTRQGQYAFNAAQLYFNYGRYEEAANRFSQIMTKYCGQDVTGFAAALMLESYKAMGAFDQVEYWAEEIKNRDECVSVPEDLMAALERDIDRFRIGAVAGQAESLYSQGRYREAAQEYVRLTNQYPESEFAPLGLFNAGLIYEQDLKEYETAMQMFERLIDEFPQSDYVDQALVRIAVNAKRFFDFDKAISTFLLLHERGFGDPELIEYPLFDAALWMQYSQQYERASQTYEQFMRENPRNAYAPLTLYRAGKMALDAGNTDRAFDLYEEYRRRYNNISNQFIDADYAVLDTLVDELDYMKENGTERQIERATDRLFDEFEARDPEEPEILYSVAERVYQDAMEVYEDWDETEVEGPVQEQREAIETRRDGIQNVLDEFDEVIGYGSQEWTVCAYYMKGRVLQRMADVVARAPLPDFSQYYSSEEELIAAEDEYLNFMEEVAIQYEDRAIENWADIALPVMRESGIVNECTEKTMRNLNRYRGEEFPVYREEMRNSQFELFSPQVFSKPMEEEENEAEMSIEKTDIDEETGASPAQDDASQEGGE
jgi:TolA-binding protein